MVLKFLRPLGALSLTVFALTSSLQPATADGADRKEVIHRTLYDIYCKQQKAELAAGEVRALIALKPNDPVLHGQLAQMFASRQEFKAAIPQYLICTKNAPSNADYWGNLGICYMQTGNYSGAVNVFTKAVTLSRAGGSNWTGQLQQAQQYVQHAQQEKAYNAQLKKQQKDQEDDN